jgi:uncharacterized protein (DUF1778 family)
MARLGLVQMTITTSAGDRDLLQHAAEARGVSVTSLVGSLIHTIAAERLTDAVLDDQIGPH